MLVALSGYSARQDRQRTREVGFDQYLTKPVELSELERLLSTVGKEQAPA